MGTHLGMVQKFYILILISGNLFILCRSSRNFALLDSAAELMWGLLGQSGTVTACVDAHRQSSLLEAIHSDICNNFLWISKWKTMG